jgi:hypothetical protein
MRVVALFLVGMIVPASTAAGGASSAASRAKILKLNWVEKTPPDQGYPAMTFGVKSVTISGPRWTIRASVTNRARDTIAVTRGQLLFGKYRFGLIVPETHNCGPKYNTMCGVDLLGAVRTTPTFPSSLKPGQSWRGTIAGTGALPRGFLISVAFGYFTDARLNREGFAWITRHSFKI